MNKEVLGRHGNNRGHWVGDGFPVRSLFSYHTLGQSISPFLLLDFAGPYTFTSTTERRGVGEHPHRGFQTVTLVYHGEVAHRDSTGNGGTIGPGDVQWMTAGRGILHDEYHSPDFAHRGGRFQMVQLWVNLPAKDKMTPPGYQGIHAKDIPAVTLPSGQGSARVIAGSLLEQRGPAQTFTPINVWELNLVRGAEVKLALPAGHTSMVVGIYGQVLVSAQHTIEEAQMLLLSRKGTDVSFTNTSDNEAKLLILTGEPIDEPIVGYGPFVMNHEKEIQHAIDDFNQGKFGAP